MFLSEGVRVAVGFQGGLQGGCDRCVSAAGRLPGNRQ